MLLCAILLAGAVSAANIPVKSSDSIQAKIDGAKHGDTLTLSNGTYNQNKIYVDKNLTITGPSATNTAIINGQKKGTVFYINYKAQVTLKYLTITNGSSTSAGGGIVNSGKLTVTGCKIIGNTASSSGGGIYNDGGTLIVSGSSINSNKASNGGGICNSEGAVTVSNSNINSNTAVTDSYSKGGGIYTSGESFTITGSNINSNTAKFFGGGIYTCFIVKDFIPYHENTVTVTNSNIKYNTVTAGNGGGIYTSNDLKVTGCDFESNKASAGEGNAIYNSFGYLTVRFNLFRNPSKGSEIFSEISNVMDAKYNWWGTNKPSGKIVFHGIDTLQLEKESITPWLVLKIKVNPTKIGLNGKSTITADLTYASNGKKQTSGYIRSIPIQFKTTLGKITSKVSTANGIAKNTLNGGTKSGTAKVSAILDSQTVSANVVIGTPAPTVTSSNPANNAVNVAASKVIKVTFNKNIKAGSKTIQLKNSTGKAIAFTKSINGKVLTIKPKSKLAESKYKLILNTGSIKDTAGNQLKAKTITFSVGTSPTVKSSDPKNNAVNVAASKVIKVTFSKNVKAGSKKIELKNSSGKAIAFTKSISGKVLTVKPKSKLAESKYKLILNTGSVTDTAGNQLKAKTITFSVGTSPTVKSSDPANNATNVALNKMIKVTFSENIKAGSNYKIELKTIVSTWYTSDGVLESGTIVTIKKSISGKVLTITPIAKLAANTKHTIILYAGSVTDQAGNPLALKTISFTTGST